MDTFKIRVAEKDGDRFTVSKKDDIVMSVPYDDSNRKIHIGLSNSENVLSVGVTETIIEKDLKVRGNIIDGENNQFVTYPVNTNTLGDMSVTPEKLFAYTGLNTSNTSVVMSQSPVVYYPNIRGELVISKLNSNSNIGNIDVLSEVQAKNVIPGKYRDGTFIYNNLTVESNIYTTDSLKIHSLGSGPNDRSGVDINVNECTRLYASSFNPNSCVSLGFSSTANTYYDILMVKDNFVEVDTKQVNNNSLKAVKINNGGLHIDARNVNGDRDVNGNLSLMKERNTVEVFNSLLNDNTQGYSPLDVDVHRVRMKVGKDYDNCMNMFYSKCVDSNRDVAGISLNSSNIENINGMTIRSDSTLFEKGIYSKVDTALDDSGVSMSNVLGKILSLNPKEHNGLFDISSSDFGSDVNLSALVKDNTYVSYLGLVPYLVQCIKDLYALINSP